jgi:hypothetical protein
LRRDFGSLLGLVRAHALLHRASRKTDENGAIIAEIADYSAVRELVVDLISDGLGKTVQPATRETVNAVADIVAAGNEHASYAQLAERLGIDRSAANRRALVALERGFLRNDEDRRGKPAKLALADPLPDDLEVLPTAEALREGCAGVRVQSEGDTPGPTSTDDGNSNEPTPLSERELAERLGIEIEGGG